LLRLGTGKALDDRIAGKTHARWKRISGVGLSRGDSMRLIQLPGTDLQVSRFAFGTASLHHLGGARAQLEHLEAAAAAGFSHFDTAPLYGFGGAEAALGSVFGDNAPVTITTKVGLYPPGGGNQGHWAMLARKGAGRLWPAMSRAVADFGVARARASLESSLKRLKRAGLDLLLLHEPVHGLVDTDEWQRWLETETGRVRHFGVAGPARTVAPFVTGGDRLARVVQLSDGLETRDADVVTDAGRPLQLTYGYFSSDRGGRSGAETAAGALARNRTGAILVYSRDRSRIAEFAAIEAQDRPC
jgi:aryl-alcohol dehydrogenase-like predicted oxidoreductase